MVKKIKVKITLEERGWPWSKWRKIQEYETKVRPEDVCEHDWGYLGNKERKCTKCKRNEVLIQTGGWDIGTEGRYWNSFLKTWGPKIK